MTPGDAARVLAAAALYDNRTIGVEDAAAWYAAIGDLDLPDALAAVTGHYRESTDRLMPAHVRRIVRDLREQRRRQQGPGIPELPGPFEHDPARQVRVQRGMATCAEVLTPLLAHMQRRQPELPALDQLRAITAGPDWATDDPTHAEENR